MIFSFDLDGVLYEYSGALVPIITSLKLAGHQVGVLSGHRQESEEKDRAKLLSMGYPEFDFYFGRRPEDMPFNGAIRKSQVLRDQEVDFHFDDYDFDHPDTIKLFAELGQETKIVRLRSREKREWSK